MDFNLLKFILATTFIVGFIVASLSVGVILFVTPRPCVQITAYGYEASGCVRENQCREYTDEPRVYCYASIAAKRKDPLVCDNLLLLRERNFCRQKASEIYP